MTDSGRSPWDRFELATELVHLPDKPAGVHSPATWASQVVLGPLKELAVFALAYNLVRSVMVEAAQARGVPVIRISVQDTVRWLIGDEAEQGGGVIVIKVNRRRSGRVEPRVKKRRPKQYLRMTAPRSVLRKRLLEQNVAA